MIGKLQIAILIILLIIVLLLVIFVLWYITSGHTGQRNGQPCSLTLECQSGLYCNGNNICQSGTGQSIDGKCTSTSDCNTGLFCNAGTCQQSFTPLITSYPSFNNKYIVSGNLYLTIINGISQLTTVKPLNTFNYNATTHILSYNNSAPLNNTVNVITNANGYLNLATNSNTVVNLYLNSNTSNLNFYISDSFGNNLQVSNNLVFFNNVTNYPKALTTQTMPIYFTIV